MIELAQATQSAQSTGTQLFGSINWSQPSWDLFIILFFIIAAFLYGLSLGRTRIVVILVSIYMALAVVSNAPFLRDATIQNQINDTLENLFVFRISMFIFLFILLFFLLSRSALLKSISPTEEAGSWWHVVLFSFLHVGLIISVVLSFLPPESAASLAPLTRSIFTSEFGRFAWIVGPILAMILIRGKQDKKFKYDM